MKYMYRPNTWDPEHEPPRIGWAPPVLDMHERPLIESRFVMPDDPKCTTVFTAGEIFEPKEPWLEQFCKSTPVFKRIRGDGST